MGVTIVDGNNVAYRVWKALGTETLTNGGFDTGVIFGFLKGLSTHLKRRDIHNEMVIVVWDCGKSFKRLEIYPEYKGSRQRDDLFTDFIRQMDEAKKILSFLPVYQLQLKGYEGDDLVAAACRLMRNQKKVIISADKDFAQLIDSNTYLYKLEMRSTNHRMIDPLNFQTIEKKCTIPFNKSLDFKILSGDVSDHIPGVKGVGPVTIDELFKTYGGIDEALQHPEELAEHKRFKKLLDQVDTIERNRKLMDLNQFLTPELLRYTGEVLLQPVTLNEYGLKEALAFFGFDSLLKDFEKFVTPFINRR